MIRRRVTGAVRVLFGFSESSPAAFRQPVHMSVEAWRHDRCGQGMNWGGIGDRFALHKCPDGDDAPVYGSVQYVGLKEQLRRTVRVFWANRPRRFIDPLEHISRANHPSAGGSGSSIAKQGDI